MNGVTILRTLSLGIILKYVVTFTLRSTLTLGEEWKAITEWVAGWALLPIGKLGKLNQYFPSPRRCEEYLGPPGCITGTGCTTKYKTHRKTKTFMCCWKEADFKEEDFFKNLTAFTYRI